MREDQLVKGETLTFAMVLPEVWTRGPVGTQSVVSPCLGHTPGVAGSGGAVEGQGFASLSRSASETLKLYLSTVPLLQSRSKAVFPHKPADPEGGNQCAQRTEKRPLESKKFSGMLFAWGAVAVNQQAAGAGPAGRGERGSGARGVCSRQSAQIGRAHV